MSRNILETILGGIVLLVAAGFVIFAFNTTSVRTSDGYRLTAAFDNAAGINVGSDVRLAGLKIGTVTESSIDAQSFMAQLELSIDDSIQLPEDSSARIVPDGLLGSNFVELEPGGSVVNLSNGGAIQFTQGAVNLADLLGRFVFSQDGPDGGGN
ncbi:MAG: outer membrane lipid asymmetry maintenance protein MlaD [Limibacillus sp.]|jgi:phospholipid/cholesterol/gamma-HCH transport system substrate-binding protein